MQGWGSRRRIGALTATGALLTAAAVVAANSGVFGADHTASTITLAASGAPSPPAAGSPNTSAQPTVRFTVTPVKTSSGHAAGLKTVGVLGRGFTVPAGWQVIDLAAHPATCVRFDVHAVYIGTPGAEQNCPARGVGRHTGAVLIQPAPAHAATATATAVDHAIAAEIDASAPGVRVTATYGSGDRSAVVSALAAAGLPSPTVATVPVPPNATVPTLTTSATPTASASVSPSASSSASPSVSAGGHASTRTQAIVSLGVTNNISGPGFDACNAPSASQMAAWTAPASPFTAIGVYIGGSERACSLQPNLTASWVSAEAQAGWHFMPIYVGWQAAWDWSPSTPSTLPAQLAIQSADDAIAQAQALGFGNGSVLYYDMEAYQTSASSAAMSFLSAWSAELRAKGYRSAVYSSENSGINDLVANLGKISEPDVIFVANWNGQEDPDPGAAPSADWPHQRVHQYLGGANATYGGVTINIDRDFFDLTVAVCAAPPEPNRGTTPYTVPGRACPLNVVPNP